MRPAFRTIAAAAIIAAASACSDTTAPQHGPTRPRSPVDPESSVPEVLKMAKATGGPLSPSCGSGNRCRLPAE